MSLAETIAQHYNSGKSEKNGNGGWICRCPSHGDKTPSMSIWDDGKGGVNVDCKTGCNFKEIKDQFRADGLLPEWEPEKKNGTKNGTAIKTTLQKPEPEPPPEPPEQEKVSFPWTKASREDLSHAKKYLSSRNIIIDQLPPCIKWNSYNDKKTGDAVNMIVAAASKPDDKNVYAIQRLFVDTEENKKTGAKMLGNCDGRGIWFDRKGDMAEIAIGEGIETVLSVIQATGKNGVAALSTSGMKGLIIPKQTETIYICADSDPVREKEAASMPGQKAAVILAERFEASREGRTAYIVSPDDSCFSDNPAKLDFNDLLKDDSTGESIQERFSKAVSFKDLQWKPAIKEESSSSLNNSQQIAAMFERFVFLASENKIIDTVGHDIKDSMMIERAFTLSQAGQFYTYEDAEGKEKTIPLTQHWLMSEEKKIASALRYSPGEPLFFTNGDGRNYYNTFRFPYQLVEPITDMEARLKNWHKIMATVFHQETTYIEDWFSFSIQHPEKRSGIMPVCISDVGLGKSLVMAIMSRVVGHQNFSNAKILDVTGLGKSGTQWGDWIFNKKISCIEEIDPEGETGISYKIVDALKDIITNETLSLNLKGGRNGTFQVYSNIIGFSNHKNCVKIPYGDRRLFIVDSTGQKNLQPEEYKEIWDWITDEQNIIAVYQYLAGREIGEDFIPGQAKMTNAKRGLQVDGRSVLQIAFDTVIKQFPSDLMTNGEIQLAVAQVLKKIDDENTNYDAVNWNAEKQFQAILKSTTTLVAQGKRIRITRKDGKKLQPSSIRAIRNAQDWIGATNDEIREYMHTEIPWNWISIDDEADVPF